MSKKPNNLKYIKNILQLFCIITFLTPYTTFAQDNPCDNNNYPIIWNKTISMAGKYSLPAIFHENENVKIFIPLNKAIPFVEANMEMRSSNQEKSKSYVLSSLKNAKPESLINIKDLMIDYEGLDGDELNIAIGVMAGYTDLIFTALINQSATVMLDKELIAEVNYILLKGKINSVVDDYDQINKIIFKAGESVIYESCWVSNN